MMAAPTWAALSSPEPKAPAAATDTGPGGVLYMEIPILGECGKDAVPASVEHCLRYCSQQQNIKHIVFRIKSPGGTVAAAREIQALMKQYADRFQYHALVEEAMCAAIWVAFACDTIHMTDGSSVGAATPFLEDGAGSASVDAKSAASIAAEMAATAAAKNHSPVLAKAMALKECEAYAWKDGDKVQVSEAAPPDVPPARLIVSNTRDALLALTRDQAVAVGFAKPARNAEDLGSSLGLEGWRKGSTYTETAMQRAKAVKEREAAAREAAIKRNIERGKATIPVIDSSLEAAAASEPSRARYGYELHSGMLTRESVQRWQRQTDAAVAAWRRVQAGALELQKLEKEADQLGVEKPTHSWNLPELYAKAGREIARLLAERDRKSI